MIIPKYLGLWHHTADPDEVWGSWQHPGIILAQPRYLGIDPAIKKKYIYRYIYLLLCFSNKMKFVRRKKRSNTKSYKIFWEKLQKNIQMEKDTTAPQNFTFQKLSFRHAGIKPIIPACHMSTSYIVPYAQLLIQFFANGLATAAKDDPKV